ncbi:MAG: NAD(P)H-binding protein [Actinomycetota bacterium]|nr:NAD(P)H-binding protein [Actinomycetota bacterium]
MNLLVIGADGRTGRLVAAAAIAAGHHVAGVIRRPCQASTQQELGAHPVGGDVTGDLTTVLAGREAVVFAAGGQVGEHRNRAGDAGVINAVCTAPLVGAGKFVLISSRYAYHPSEDPEFLRLALSREKADLARCSRPAICSGRSSVRAA